MSNSTRQTFTPLLLRMAVILTSRESYVNAEVDEYQEFPVPQPKEAATEMTTTPNFGHLRVVLLSVGLLCILQGSLNIALRLALREPSVKVETEGRSCPRGWLMFASSCYYVSSQRRNWDDSREDCLQRNADLVIINSRREQAFLTGFSMAAWVGMTDREEEGTWLWVDGTEVDKDSLQWARGQPDGAFGGEDCGDLRTMITFIGLNDFNCSAITQWICEKRLQ